MPDLRDEEIIWLFERFPEWAPMLNEPSANTGWIRLCGIQLSRNTFIALKDLACFIESLR